MEIEMREMALTRIEILRPKRLTPVARETHPASKKERPQKVRPEGRFHIRSAVTVVSAYVQKKRPPRESGF
jgi:hypothetical protein